MKIYIKTPLLNNSQTVPHMVEHCIRKNKKPDVRRFFESHLPCEHWINWERTHIFVDYWKELESVVREIKIWLNREIYEFEKRPFKEECNNKTEWNIIFEAMLQQLISPEIRLNTWKGKTWKRSINTTKPIIKIRIFWFLKIKYLLIKSMSWNLYDHEFVRELKLKITFLLRIFPLIRV